MKSTFTVGDTLTAINNQPLPGNKIAPPLKLAEPYTVKGIIQDSQGNDHIDVGIPSAVEYVRSYETGEELPGGDNIWFCHPSRFILSSTKTA